jgi:hypothetical protein
MVLPDPDIDILLVLLLGNPIDGIAEYEEDMDGVCEELGRWASVAMAERY